MKLPCEIIRDLLPLYHDGVCSEVSKTLVNEHLRDCKDCAKALRKIDIDIDVPKLEADAVKPLKSLQNKWNKRTWQKGILIGLAVFMLVFTIWFSLTQLNYVPLAVEEYSIESVCRFSNGMYYLEYSHPYAMDSYSANICRTEDGAIHLTEYRPRLAKKQDVYSRTTRSYLIDPANKLLHTDTGEEVPLTAFYLGCPDKADAILLWSTDMDVPLASPELEGKHLHDNIFR